MIRSNSDVAFDVIDPASPPEPDHFVKPNRPLIIGVGCIAGLLLGCAWAFLRDFCQQYQRRRATVAQFATIGEVTAR